MSTATLQSVSFLDLVANFLDVVFDLVANVFACDDCDGDDDCDRDSGDEFAVNDREIYDQTNFWEEEDDDSDDSGDVTIYDS